MSCTQVNKTVLGWQKRLSFYTCLSSPQPYCSNIFIQWCFDKGTIPDGCNTEVVYPIPESSSNVSINYQGIMLTSLPYKMHGCIWDKSLSNCLELNHALFDEQRALGKIGNALDIPIAHNQWVITKSQRSNLLTFKFVILMQSRLLTVLTDRVYCTSW